MMEFPAYTPASIKSIVAEMWRLQPADRPDFCTIAKRMNDVQAMYPPPRPQMCTISRIKGVTVLSAQEIEVLQESTEDIQFEAAVSSMSTPQPSVADLPPSINGNVVDKQGQVKNKDVPTLEVSLSIEDSLISVIFSGKCSRTKCYQSSKEAEKETSNLLS